MNSISKRISPETVEAVQEVLKKHRISFEDSGWGAPSIQYAQGSNPEIVRLSVQGGRFCAHTTSSDWELSDFFRESQELQTILKQLKVVCPELCKGV